MLIMHILDILKKYTDEDHRLSQKEIGEILKNEYDMVVDRKSIKRNLMDLIDLGFEIEYSESVRLVPNKVTGQLEESCFLSDFYLVRNFAIANCGCSSTAFCSPSTSPTASAGADRQIDIRIANRYFRARVGHIRTMPDLSLHSQQLFYTIEVLDEAIGKGRQVSFTYNSYGTDKKLHPRRDSAGNVREYIVNPYQIAAANGRYYLICNYDKYDNVAHYRLDRITNIKLLPTPAKPMEQVKGWSTASTCPVTWRSTSIYSRGKAGR